MADSDDGFAGLVARVKDLCRSDPTAKGLWRSWCDVNAGCTKDPNLMDEPMLTAFFEAYETGGIELSPANILPTLKGGIGKDVEELTADGSEDGFLLLVGRVKALCRSDPSAKDLWRSWCDANAQGTKDPKLMDELMLTAFFNAYDSGDIAPSSDPPAAKPKGRTGAVVEGLTAELDGSEDHDALIGRVKSLCRSDPRAKALWRSWCDANAEGTKDPKLMHEAMLHNFFAAYASGSIEPSSDTPLPAPKGGTGNDVEDLAMVVRMGQKVSPSWKAAWVMYCEAMGDRTFDPSRHPKEFLQGFIESCGVCALQAAGGAPVPSPVADPFARVPLWPEEGTMPMPTKRPRIL